MPSAIWKGALRFGLVNIPVVLRPAETADELDLDLLDKRSLEPVGYQKINKVSGKEIPNDQIVRGYEVSDGKYVVITPQELKAANIEATRTIDVLGFVEQKAIEPFFYDRPYYLEPEKAGVKAYQLLREALRKTERMGLATLVLRTRQYLSVVYPHDKVLVVNLLRYEHEMRSIKELEVPAEKVAPQELAMAEKLIEMQTLDWEPKQYRDEYRDDLLALIRRKAKKGTHAVPEPVEEEEEKAPKAQVIDLVALLQKSLGERSKATHKRAPAQTHAHKPHASKPRARKAS